MIQPVQTSNVIKANFSFIDYYNSFIAYIQTAESTKQTYTRQIKQFMLYLSNNNISNPERIDVLNYIEHLKSKGLKPTTVQNYVIAVRQLFNWLEVEYGLPNVAKGIKGAKVSKSHKKDNFSMGQVADIIRRIDTDSVVGKRDKAITLLVVTTALRTIEVNRANVDDLRYIDGKHFLIIQGKGHDEKDTLVQLTDTTYRAIQDYLSTRSDKLGNSPLFTSTSNNSKGNRITPRTISGLLKKRFKDAGLDSPRLTAHSLRHTGITEAYRAMKKAGISDTLSEVQKYARHANPATTQIYIHEEEQKNSMGASLVASALDNALSELNT